jgi:signal transduction histidine kinase
MRRRLLGIGIIAAVTFLQIATQYVIGHERGRLVSHLLILSISLPVHMTLFSVGFAWATRRRISALVTVLVGVIVAGAAGAVFGYLVWTLARYVPGIRPPTPGPWRLSRAVLFGFMSGQVNLGLWALAFVFPFALEDARIRSLEADKLRLETEKLRTSAELARLRAHLEPHFLLNTLNAIAGLVTEDPREARRLLACLGDLLRDALKDEGEMQTLEDQVRWLRRYASILEARHPGHLAFRWQIAANASPVLLPRLLLQPLVENAVKHGALRRASGGEVVVRAEVSDANGHGALSQRLTCTIEDNGPGIPDEATRSGAFGLHAVRRRLELKYFQAASLRLESSSDGTRSIVELPLHAAAAGRAS